MQDSGPGAQRDDEIPAAACSPDCYYDSDLGEDRSYDIFKLSQPSASSVWVNIKLEQVDIPMEVDMGVFVTVISEATEQNQRDVTGTTTAAHNVKLRNYTREEIPMVGRLTV